MVGSDTSDKGQTLRCERVSWHQVQKLCLELATKISDAGFVPDVVVAIARGGFVPARLLCDYLGIVELASIRIAHYTAGAHKMERARLAAPLNLDVRGRKVLIVDDVSDTGDTLELARAHIGECGAAEVQFAALHYKRVSRCVPDFYGQEIIRWRWLVYPWAMVEDLGGLLREMSPRPADSAQAQLRLEKDVGVRVGKRILDYILRHTSF